MVPGCARHGARCGGDYWCLDVLSNGTCLSGWEFKGYTKKRMDAIAWIQVWLLLISDFWFFSSGHLAPFSLKKEHHCLQGFCFCFGSQELGVSGGWQNCQWRWTWRIPLAGGLLSLALPRASVGLVMTLIGEEPWYSIALNHQTFQVPRMEVQKAI